MRLSLFVCRCLFTNWYIKKFDFTLSTRSVKKHIYRTRRALRVSTRNSEVCIYNICITRRYARHRATINRSTIYRTIIYKVHRTPELLFHYFEIIDRSCFILRTFMLDVYIFKKVEDLMDFFINAYVLSLVILFFCFFFIIRRKSSL
jgi:hypothetical protein